MNWVDVPMDKEKISITKHRFLNGGTTYDIVIKNNNKDGGASETKNN